MLMFITFLVNSRHLLMGASLVPYLRNLPNKQVFPALFLCVMKVGRLPWQMHKKDKLRRASIMPLICLFTQVLFCSLPDVGWIHRIMRRNWSHFR